MKNNLIKLVINIISFMLVVYFMPGIQVDSWRTATISAVILTLVNIFFKPIILIFTLPFNLVSLGLFTLIINGFLFYLVSKVVQGFYVAGFWCAFWGALIFSIISIILNMFFNIQMSFKFYNNRSFSKKKYNNVIDVDAKEE
jgi:putative membrane protein